MDQFRCGKCGQLRDAEQYPPSQQHNGGYCRQCKREYEKAHPRKRYDPDNRYFSKTCYRCGKERQPDDRLHTSYCADCSRAYNREQYATKGRRATKACSMCGEERKDKVHAAYCPRCFYIWRLQYKYGITPDDYQAMLDSQNGGCAICGITQTQVWKEGWNHPLEVDHDHDTGKVRGLLCSSCNVSLGRFKHDPALLRRAADYLEASVSA